MQEAALSEGALDGDSGEGYRETAPIRGRVWMSIIFEIVDVFLPLVGDSLSFGENKYESI